MSQTVAPRVFHGIRLPQQEQMLFVTDRPQHSLAESLQAVCASAGQRVDDIAGFELTIAPPSATVATLRELGELGYLWQSIELADGDVYGPVIKMAVRHEWRGLTPESVPSKPVFPPELAETLTQPSWAQRATQVWNYAAFLLMISVFCTATLLTFPDTQVLSLIAVLDAPTIALPTILAAMHFYVASCCYRNNWRELRHLRQLELLLEQDYNRRLFYGPRRMSETLSL